MKIENLYRNEINFNKQIAHTKSTEFKCKSRKNIDLS